MKAELGIDQKEVPTGRFSYLAAKLKYAHHARTSNSVLKSRMIAYPERRSKLRKELAQSTKLGVTPDGKQIYLFDYSINSSVIRELGRLRELTFRAVGEGTQQLRDIDKYDQTYRHIILWDSDEQEIVGAYRIGEAFKLATNDHYDKLYTNELFEFSDKIQPFFAQAVELGRSFIQPQYWNKRGLDYLWQGVGAYLTAHPQVRYLFGAVSISNDLPDLAKQQIVGYYHHFFKPSNAHQYARARLPYISNRGVLESYRGSNMNSAANDLKKELSKQGVSLPTLYKHYSGLCDDGGVTFLDFNIDPSFSFCIDGLILIDLNCLKESKKKRYLCV